MALPSTSSTSKALDRRDKTVTTSLIFDVAELATLREGDGPEVVTDEFEPFNDLTGLRTQAICRLHALLCGLTPGGAGRLLSAPQAFVVGSSDAVRRYVKALDRSTWPVFAALVEANNGIFGGCWCIGFHPEGCDRWTTRT